MATPSGSGSKRDAITVMSVLIALVCAVAAVLVVPEFRRWAGLSPLTTVGTEPATVNSTTPQSVPIPAKRKNGRGEKRSPLGEDGRRDNPPNGSVHPGGGAAPQSSLGADPAGTDSSGKSIRTAPTGDTEGKTPNRTSELGAASDPQKAPTGTTAPASGGQQATPIREPERVEPPQPAATIRENDLIFTLTRCRRSGSGISCKGSVSNNLDRSRWVYFGSGIDVVDNLGGEYRFAPIRHMEAKLQFATDLIKELEPNLPINFTVEADNVDPAATKVTIILTYGAPVPGERPPMRVVWMGETFPDKLVFRDIPIQPK